MRGIKLSLLLLLSMVYLLPMEAHINPTREYAQNQNSNSVSYREDCTTADAQIDQSINNVRARLTTGGDVWWDRSDGRYVVPKSGDVSSIFAGGVWLGGFDPGGNLKVAAQTYGNASGNSDFWPGPLDPESGTTDLEICNKWDEFFVVTAEEIDMHLGMYQAAADGGGNYSADLIPRGVKSYPARGNQFFAELNGFELPNTEQGLAPFFDRNGNMLYEPLDGDYPVIEIRGCVEPQYADEMIFWIYNDAGGVHEETMGAPLRMEVQVQSFAYATNDELNDMTFQRYKLINRGQEDVDSTYFAMWVDGDLGCYLDDYIGCDTSRSLAILYNADATDGQPGDQCDGVPTYGTDIPVLGVDYFRGPLKPIFAPGADPDIDEPIDTLELGMSSFTYFNNNINSPPPGTTDPNTAVEFYNYLSGSWRDGSPFTFGDDGYQDGEIIDYAFPGNPANDLEWSMCSANLPEYDRRTVQASGPFRLRPGAVNELIVGVPWVPSRPYPCPDMSRLFAADDLAQALFDNCFDIVDGPDAPDVDWVELDQCLVAVLTNDTDTIASNNAGLMYSESDILAPEGTEDSLYRFEGYLLYQLAGPSVSISELDDPDRARLVLQTDLRNGVGEIYNFESAPGPNDTEVSVPVLKVDGSDQGLQTTVKITQDLFASGDNNRLINHKTYYYTVIAYAYNNYQQFDPLETSENKGQRFPYLEGRGNIGPNSNQIFYEVTPRPITYEQVNSEYGETPIITRLDGVGIGDNFVDISEETREAIISGGFDGRITYKQNEGPVDVKIYNPLEVRNGEYLLEIRDSNMDDEEIDETARWVLTDLTTNEVIESNQTIFEGAEQVVGDFGFSVNVTQTLDVGANDERDRTNGVIGYEEDYFDGSEEGWFGAITADLRQQILLYDWVSTDEGEADFELDIFQTLDNIGTGIFVPYSLLDFNAANSQSNIGKITPVWLNNFGSFSRTGLNETPNIDIVFTSDKSKWSRCVILEAGNQFYEQTGALTEGGVEHMRLRAQPSVGKEDSNGDGLPDPDGAVSDITGEPINGMGWFPGYAIDVETGRRLNIFFAENSIYGNPENADFFPDGVFENDRPTGADMTFNPTSQVFAPVVEGFQSILNFPTGGQHHVYVTRTPYDECEYIHWRLERNGNSALRVGQLFKRIAWAGTVIPNEGEALLSYADGLIPSDVAVKLRVSNPYQVEPAFESDWDDDEIGITEQADIPERTGTGVNNFHPAWRLDFRDVESTELTAEQLETALDSINVVPNPYYAFSDYEDDQFDNIVKITNLPAEATITIYSLDGKFIRQYERDERATMPTGNNRGITTNQVNPDLEWDLKNGRGIPIASGVYLIHVSAPGLGERTIKWFGIRRQFDPSGL